ncbi:amino acid permease family protein [Apiospora rasikravindrae]|uniref:Amino acid permease family protein n=1 Tax=Apiospora rasikravindrae TaxID=990691 RepID=A0ABR1RPA0_9PEZI
MDTDIPNHHAKTHSRPADVFDQDDQDLADLGHEQALTRKFSLWSMLALTFSVLGTWATMAQNLASGLSNGGPVSILWGLVLVLGCNVAVALSLGELCSAMPTTLGQAYWISRLWPTPTGRFMSYMCAWINTFGWWALSASQIAFMTNFMLSMKLLFDPDWEGGSIGWVQFVVYLGLTLAMTVINLVSCRHDKILPLFNDVVGITFAALFCVVSLALLISVGAKPDLHFQSASFVFGSWVNETGWSDGIVWFIGLVQAAYGLTAYDSAIHMIEEIPNPRANVPKVMWLSVVCGAVTGFIFCVVCLFSVQSLEDILSPMSSLPFIDLLWTSTGLDGACVLLALFIFNGFGQGTSIVTSASRLTWSFARDGGLPWSGYLSKVDETWKVPARATWAQGIVIGLIGVLYIFANTVLEAILSVSTIALTISYAMPIMTLLCVGRDKLPSGPFRLGRVGPAANWISIVYCCITTVFFFFPSSPHPAASDMNYAIAVFGIMMCVALSFWFLKGRHTYFQDSVDIEGRSPGLRPIQARISDSSGLGPKPKTEM